MALENAVVALRHDYGDFSLARLTPGQESALRDAGYEVRVFEDPDRIGIGPFSFKVPAGPSGIPLELAWRERRGETDAHLVRLIGPADDGWLDQIRRLGGEILTPIPSFAYLVRLAPQTLSRVAALPFVEWVGPYQPAFKLSAQLAGEFQSGSLSSGPRKLTVLIYRSGDVEEVLNQIRGMQGEILGRAAVDFYEEVRIRISGRHVPDLARLSDVYAVEAAPEPKLEDESSTQILAGQVDASLIPFRPALGEPSFTDWLAARNLNGANVTIGYVDDGVANSDPTGHLNGRVNESICGPTGASSVGHGHFGAATAGGSCSHAGESGTGYRFGLGLAPSVNFINLPGLKAGTACPVDLTNDGTINSSVSSLARLTVTSTGPLNGQPGTIQNNSWGSGSGDNTEDVSYTSLERIYDIVTRDADSTTLGNQQLVTCFSAGNEAQNTPGCPGVSGQKDCPVTLTRPHVAKNILTTGSSSVYRPANTGTNIDNRSFYSSEGPAMDGRIKPDFMAPGGGLGANAAALTSAMIPGTTVGIALGDGVHGISAGTSFATPQTAGGAALLVQWWRSFTSAIPSPAMVKALLINSARDMQNGNVPAATPNRGEGWGRWNLGNVIDPGTPTVVSAPPLFKKTSGLPTVYLDQGVVLGNTGDQFQVRFVPGDVTKPLLVTLIWTDAPAAVGACPSLVNDLDLEVLQNGKSLLRGNALSSSVSVAGGPVDQRNNVEQVIQPNPSGFYTLTVRAVTLAGDGVPGNGDTTDQDFALVVTNAVAVTTPILAAGTVTRSDICSGSGSGGNGVIDPGESVTFSVPLVNSGNAMATSVSGTLTTSTPGVSILDGSSAYANIASGATVNPNAGDTLGIQLSGSVSCGSGVDLTYNVSTAQGVFAVPIHFDVGAKTVTTQNLTGSSGAVNNDINNPSLFTTPAATAGTIQGVTVDVNITNPTSGRGSAYLFGDYVAELVAPSSTAVTLHSNPLPCFSLVGNYPNTRLAQEGSLDAFKGQDAAGVWSLRVTSRNNIICSGGGPSGPCSSANVNSWALHVTRESGPACNTCVANNPPPEVSGLGSGTPLILTYDDSTGAATFTWQNLGSQADSYRLLGGLIGSLAGTGMTSSNTSPVQCGILTAGTTLVPPAGDRFFLVVAQKGALVGPLGQATDPVTFPRSSSQTCP